LGAANESHLNNHRHYHFRVALYSPERVFIKHRDYRMTEAQKRIIVQILKALKGIERALQGLIK
jgi:hypothetical protein